MQPSMPEGCLGSHLSFFSSFSAGRLDPADFEAAHSHLRHQDNTVSQAGTGTVSMSCLVCMERKVEADVGVCTPKPPRPAVLIFTQEEGALSCSEMQSHCSMLALIARRATLMSRNGSAELRCDRRLGLKPVPLRLKTGHFL